MISFVVCDDNKKINEKIVNVIDQIMMKNKIPYKKYIYFDYDKEFLRVIKEKRPNKIYILDIETPSGSGIDIARKIREKDMNSIIIFLTSHDELGYVILKQEFMFLSFICKFDDYEKKLTDSIKKALKIVGQRKVLSINDSGVLYNIPLDDILYITRDSVDRKCIIKTEYTEFRVNKALSDLLEHAGPNFKQSHRACIVNMDRIIAVHKKKRELQFDNNDTINLVNEDFLKEVSGK